MENILDAYREKVKETMLPMSEFCLFSDLSAQEIAKEYREKLCALAEKYLQMEYEPLLASYYMIFSQSGDRTFYEPLSHKRRQGVFHLFLGEYLEKNGRYLTKLVDLIWMILEETSWVIPAHSRTEEPLDDNFMPDVSYIDLFSAETGAVLSLALAFCGNQLDSITPLIRKRLYYELQRRLILPFITHKEWWWMGESGRKLNNWTPWICSNILLVTAICEEDMAIRRAVADRAMVLLDRFTKTYSEDGGCDEGAAYWNVAGGSYFDCLEILYDMTGGKVSLFTIPFVRRMGEYVANVNICDHYYVNYADGAPINHFSYAFMARIGRRTGSEFLKNFALDHVNRHETSEISWNPYRELKTLFESLEDAAPYDYPTTLFLQGVDVLIRRENKDPHKGLFFSMKGGNNAENHNHNDVGNFILYADGRPLIIDVGVGIYQKDTFNENRYKIWTMQSAYHNLPTFDGVMQENGKEYSAKLIESPDVTGALEVELASAYPNCVALQSYRRRGELHENEALIVDTVSLSKPTDVEFHFMTMDLPTIESAGMIRFSQDLLGKYPERLQAQIETIELHDSKLQRVWNREKLYRISLSVTGVQDETFSFRFSRVRT